MMRLWRAWPRAVSFEKLRRDETKVAPIYRFVDAFPLFQNVYSQAEYRMSSKKVNGFVDQITRSFGKFMCGGNALRNIDEGEQSMMVKSQAPGFTRSPAKSPAMQSFRPKLCALDFDLTLTQNQVWCAHVSGC